MSNKELNEKLRKVRPSLYSVSPFVTRIIQGFAAINLALGAFLYSESTSNAGRVVIVNDLLTLQVYGLLFITLGVVMFWGLIRNDWNLLKATLIIGLFLKIVWMAALAYLMIKGSSGVLLVLWTFFTYVQFMCYIYFIPSGRRHDDK